MNIRIISIPPGEAPEEVRTAWVGLVLPVAVSGVQSVEAAGVLSRPTTGLGLFFARLLRRTKRESVYIVEAHRAVEILSAYSPDAARWWKANAAPSIEAGQFFGFVAEVCEVVE